MKLENKLNDATSKNTAFVFDFDGTMIHKFIGTDTVPSIISILRSEKILGEEYSEKAFALSSHYGAIEHDHSIPKDEKVILMTEWWQKHLALLVKAGLTRANIEKAAKHPKLILRDGVLKLLKLANNKNIPVFIFSASGIGVDAIKPYLKSKNLLTQNIHVISNSFIFNESGLAIGRNLPLIHSMNKNEEVLQSFAEEKDLLLLKTHILLLGDSLEDPQMVSNTHHTNIFRAGFLNEKDVSKVELLTPKYNTVYDVVLTADSEALEIYNSIEAIL